MFNLVRLRFLSVVSLTLLFVPMSLNAMKGGKPERLRAEVFLMYKMIFHEETNAQRPAFCVGHFIANTPGEWDIAITSAHCLGNFDDGGVQILGGARRSLSTGRSDGISIRAIVHNSLSSPDGIDSTKQAMDIAILAFPDGTANSSSRLGTQIGQSQFDSAGNSLTKVSTTSWTSLPINQPATRLSDFTHEKLSGNNVISGMNHIKEKVYHNGSPSEQYRAIGYLTHESTGAIPNLKGESGSPLYNSTGLIGILRGCDTGIVREYQGGEGCSYVSVFTQEANHVFEKSMQVNEIRSALEGFSPRQMPLLVSKYTRGKSLVQSTGSNTPVRRSIFPERTRTQAKSSISSQLAKPVSPKQVASVEPSVTTTGSLPTARLGNANVSKGQSVASAELELSPDMKRLVKLNRDPRADTEGAKLQINRGEEGIVKIAEKKKTQEVYGPGGAVSAPRLVNEAPPEKNVPPSVDTNSSSTAPQKVDAAPPVQGNSGLPTLKNEAPPVIDTEK